MSDSEDSTVTYTEVSSLFADLSDIGSPGVDGRSVMPEDPYAYMVAAFQAPPSPDYVPGLEEPKQAPPSPFYVPYVPEPAYPEFMPPEDESDPKEDPEEDGDEDPEEDPADYPADGGDDAVALPAVDHAPSAEETEPFETDESAATPPPHPAYRVTARILIRDEPPIPFWSYTEVARLLVIPTLPPSPLSLWSSPLPQIPSPPLPSILSPLHVSSLPPASHTYTLGYRAALIRLRAETPSTSHSPPTHIILSHTRADTPPLGTPPLLPIPLPTSSPSLLLPSANHRADRPEVCLPPRKRLCFAFGPRYEVGESSSTAAARSTRGFKADYGFVATMDREIRRDLERDIGYGITDTWDEMLVDMSGAPTTDETELGRRMTEFATRVRDRRAHARTTLLMEREARIDYRVAGSGPQETGGDYRVADSGPQETGILQAMIDQGVTATLAARDADRNTNDDDSHNSGTGVRRTERTAREFDHDAAYGMPWKTLMKMITGKYCPRNEIKKLKMEIWNLKVKESDKIEKYVGGLPDMIHGSVVASKPKTMQEAVEIATELMDKKIRTFDERQTKSKRKQDDNQQQQQQNKRQNTSRAYIAGTGEKKQYWDPKPPQC
ncbi:hypothetical protein Tco_0711970 [Tanacetum coccineum]